jgi:hypothetical protein
MRLTCKHTEPSRYGDNKFLHNLKQFDIDSDPHTDTDIISFIWIIFMTLHERMFKYLV